MSTHVLLVDLLALLFAICGFHLAFRQRAVRRWLNVLRAHRGRPPLRAPAANAAEDPAHYAMIISGTMMLAFGIILFGFTTMYSLTT